MIHNMVHNEQMPVSAVLHDVRGSLFTIPGLSHVMNATIDWPLKTGQRRTAPLLPRVQLNAKICLEKPR